MFEPGTGEILEIPVPFALIHDEELVDYSNEALASEFFASYLASGGEAPDLRQCVGYRTPLFLGGEDDLPNLELIDTDVYWHLVGQLILRTKGCRTRHHDRLHHGRVAPHNRPLLPRIGRINLAEVRTSP